MRSRTGSPRILSWRIASPQRVVTYKKVDRPNTTPTVCDICTIAVLLAQEFLVCALFSQGCFSLSVVMIVFRKYNPIRIQLRTVCRGLTLRKKTTDYNRYSENSKKNRSCPLSHNGNHQSLALKKFLWQIGI